MGNRTPFPSSPFTANCRFPFSFCGSPSGPSVPAPCMCWLHDRWSRWPVLSGLWGGPEAVVTAAVACLAAACLAAACLAAACLVAACLAPRSWFLNCIPRQRSWSYLKKWPVLETAGKSKSNQRPFYGRLLSGQSVPCAWVKLDGSWS